MYGGVNMRFRVIFANRGYFPRICKFTTRLDAVKFALHRFKSGFDFIRIDEFQG